MTHEHGGKSHLQNVQKWIIITNVNIEWVM